MRNGGDTTPYQTDYEVGLDIPGLAVNVVVSHDKFKYNERPLIEDMGGFVRFEPVGFGDPEVMLEGRFTAEQLLALFLVLKDKET